MTSEEANSTAPLPPRWPSEVEYLSKLRWKGIPQEVKVHYEDEVDVLSIYVDLIPRSNDGMEGEEKKEGEEEEQCVVSRQVLQCGAWLCEIVGNVISDEQATKQRKSTTRKGIKKEEEEVEITACFLYKTDEGKRFFIQPLSNNPMTKMRRLKRGEDRSIANLKTRRIWMEGRIKAYLEISKEIKEREELIMDYDSDDDSFLKIDDLPLNEEQDVQEDELTQCSYHLLNEEDARFFTENQNLSSCYQIKKVVLEGHPCNGQNGLFAVRGIKQYHYLGEYTGDVVIHDPDNAIGKERIYSSRYLMDFSNPYTGEDIVLKESWVDADIAGNELRFINDASGTSKESNVHFKRAWLSGKMHVICQALQEIHPGDELLVEYGERYWENVQFPQENEGEQYDEEAMEESDQS
eukprot:TRINITY_DN824_c0_g1_i1.p1 TRINITY_DN824_c0_g1~~TRINITY_DN824_c0_g1_i1.p1  ORF type:complete len:407 (-),score=151.04 TRINITY_DN824_c0_g1_i1:165-1385(-)